MRLFVALEIPAAVRQAIDKRVRLLSPQLPPARWVALENLHLTLVFVGETEDSRRLDLEESLSPIFVASPPLRLSVIGGGCFPAGRPARVAWVGVTADKGLEVLQRGVREVVDAVSERPPEKRAFHPHVTLARMKRPWPQVASGRYAEAMSGSFDEPFEVSVGTLFVSRLSRQGAQYEVLTHLPMGVD